MVTLSPHHYKRNKTGRHNRKNLDMGCYDQNIISCRGYFYFRPQINEVPYFRIGEIMETANEASHDSNTDIYIIDGIHYKVIKTTEDGGEK